MTSTRTFQLKKKKKKKYFLRIFNCGSIRLESLIREIFT